MSVDSAIPKKHTLDSYLETFGVKQVGKGKEGQINSNRSTFNLGVMNSQCIILMTYYLIIHLKPV